MKKILAYILTPIYFILFGLTLVIFHPLQWLALKLGGYEAHKKVVDYLSFVLVYILYALGTKITFNNKYNLPNNTPLIIVANHQSMNDIPALLWLFHKYHELN